MKRFLFVTVALVVAAATAGATGKVVVVETQGGGNRAPWRGAAGNAMRFQCLWFQSGINY
ncbi:unnamed protein product, partial [marine sediment metagenome]